MALASPTGIPGGRQTLLTLRWQCGNNWVITWNWTDFCGTTWGPNFGEEIYVGLVIVTPLTGEVVFVINCLYRANRFACTAVNALIRVDVEHAVTLVDTVHRAFVNAGLVFNIDAWKRNHIGHFLLLNELLNSRCCWLIPI
jgi:hypothetical protein